MEEKIEKQRSYHLWKQVNRAFDQSLNTSYTSNLDVSLDKLKDIHRSIRQLNNNFPNPSKVPFVKLYKEWIGGQPVNRLVVFSPVIYGCEYRLKTGGCSMCGEALGIGRTPSLFQAIKPIVDLIGKWSLIPQWVCWYVEGSNLNTKEFPLLGLETGIKLFAEQGVKRVTIESRPEYVTEDILDVLENIGKTYGAEIEIGIGIETYNEFIRDYCIFKGFSWSDFKEAVGKIKERQNIRALAYVLLKPPFLSEGEAIADAERTAAEAFKIGVDVISLELLSIAEFTLCEYMWFKKFYRPPWVWSAIKVLEDTYDEGEVRVGGEPETYHPFSAKAAYNDDKCTVEVWESLQEYNRTHKVDRLKRLSCNCKQTWFEKIGEIKAPLKSDITRRLINTANNLHFDEYIKLKLNSYFKGT